MTCSVTPYERNTFNNIHMIRLRHLQEDTTSKPINHPLTLERYHSIFVEQTPATYMSQQYNVICQHFNLICQHFNLQTA